MEVERSRPPSAAEHSGCRYATVPGASSSGGVSHPHVSSVIRVHLGVPLSLRLADPPLYDGLIGALLV